MRNFCEYWLVPLWNLTLNTYIESMSVIKNVDEVDCLDDGRDKLYTYENRLLTFETWNKKVSPEELAKAGFFYKLWGDVVQCAFCSCEFNNWNEGDDPLEDHYKFCKSCTFAKVLWKSRNIKRNSSPHLNSPPVNPKNNVAEIQPLINSKICKVSLFFIFIVLVFLNGFISKIDIYIRNSY